MTKDKHEYEQPETEVVLAANDYVNRVSSEHYKQQMKGAKELLDQAAKENARLSEQNEVLAKSYQKEVEQLRNEKRKLEKSGFETTVAWDAERRHRESLSTENAGLKAEFASLQVEFDALQEKHVALETEHGALCSKERNGHEINVYLHEALIQAKEALNVARMVDPAGWMLDPTVPIPIEERRRIAKNYGFVDAELNHSYKSVYIVLIIALTLVAFGVLEVMQ